VNVHVAVRFSLIGRGQFGPTHVAVAAWCSCVTTDWIGAFHARPRGEPCNGHGSSREECWEFEELGGGRVRFSPSLDLSHHGHFHTGNPHEAIVEEWS